MNYQRKRKKRRCRMERKAGLTPEEFDALVRLVKDAIENLDEAIACLVEAGIDIDEIAEILDDEELRKDAELIGKIVDVLKGILRKMQRLEDRL
jgi:transcription termination factor NusB